MNKPTGKKKLIRKDERDPGTQSANIYVHHTFRSFDEKAKDCDNQPPGYIEIYEFTKSNGDPNKDPSIPVGADGTATITWYCKREFILIPKDPKFFATPDAPFFYTKDTANGYTWAAVKSEPNQSGGAYKHQVSLTSGPVAANQTTNPIEYSILAGVPCELAQNEVSGRTRSASAVVRATIRLTNTGNTGLER